MTRAGPSRLRWLLAAGFVLVAGAVLTWALVGDRSSRTGAEVRKGATVPDVTSHFGEVGFRIQPHPDDGEPGAAAQTVAAATGCLLSAETSDEHGQGLMGVLDLGPYDGMVFRFRSDTTGAFFMKNTPMPLSIAWFDANGLYVSSTDMVPCLDAPSCPFYEPAGPYRTALEVPRGRLGPLGVSTGSRLVLTPACP